MCYHKAVPQGVDLTATCSSTPSHTLKATAYFQTTNPNLGDYLRSNGVSYSDQLIIRLGGGGEGGGVVEDISGGYIFYLKGIWWSSGFQA